MGCKRIGKVRHAQHMRKALAERKTRGQSTVEYAIVLAAFIALVLGLGTLWHAAADGKFSSHALESASHHVGGSNEAWADVVAY